VCAVKIILRVGVAGRRCKVLPCRHKQPSPVGMSARLAALGVAVANAAFETLQRAGSGAPSNDGDELINCES
jgi:hypothetical protein